VAGVRVVEGQGFTTADLTEVRRPLWDVAQPLALVVDRIDATLVGSEALHLGVTLAGAGGVQEARINHPARYGATIVLADSAGLAPVLWLQDARGFSLDRVAVVAATRSAQETVVSLADGSVDVVIGGVGSERSFPRRSELQNTALGFQVRRRGEVLFSGVLRPGERAVLGDGALVLEEIRYWVGLRVVSERGGFLLVSGFVLAISALVWRLLWYRREVAVVSRDGKLEVHGRCELYPTRFREELAAVRAVLRRELEASANENNRGD